MCRMFGCACQDGSAVSNKGLKALSEARFAAGTFRDAVSLVAFLFLVQRGRRPHLHRCREPSFDIHQHPRAVRMSLHGSYQQSVLDAVEGTLGTLPTASSRITPSRCGLFDRAILWKAKCCRSWAGVVGAAS